MSERTGTISVETTDIFPIIKKWLYSEHDIFIRELVANATDAITKRSSISRTQNKEIPAGKIEILLNKSEKIIQVKDNGVGMTEEEVEKYIARLAFSGAEEFIQKMEAEKSGGDIIGKFGLGFYSSFMVADKVVVDSLSMEEDAKAVRWTSEGETTYTFSDSDRKDIGTTITLHVSDQGAEFLNEFKLSEILRKFCDFMPYEISVLDLERKPEKPRKDDGTIDEKAEAVPVQPTVINSREPLWKKNPGEVKDEEYKEFYRYLFPMDREPLFWLHLKIDHPFTLEGILYFPKLSKKINVQERNIRLFCKQVFVSDDVKNVIPEFLCLLKGTIDSTDIPLNVSRSSLQGDPNIRKISNYVVKKVAEELKKLFNKDRKRYHEIWPDIALFVKYGCVSDSKFDELMRDRLVFKNANGDFVTLDEYKESIPAAFKEKVGDKVVYFEQGKSDPALVSQLATEKIYALEVDDHIDPHLMQHLEMKKQGDKTLSFSSVDTEIENLLETENQSAEDGKIKDMFSEVLSKEQKEDEVEPVTVEIQKLKNASAPAYFKVDEQMKRFAKMTQNMSGGESSLPIKRTLVINPKSPLIQNAFKMHEKGNTELVKKICHHVEDLAGISVDGLSEEGKEKFVKRSQDLIQELTDLAL